MYRLSLITASATMLFWVLIKMQYIYAGYYILSVPVSKLNLGNCYTLITCLLVPEQTFTRFVLQVVGNHLALWYTISACPNKTNFTLALFWNYFLILIYYEFNPSLEL